MGKYNSKVIFDKGLCFVPIDSHGTLEGALKMDKLSKELGVQAKTYQSPQWTVYTIQFPQCSELDLFMRFTNMERWFEMTARLEVSLSDYKKESKGEYFLNKSRMSSEQTQAERDSRASRFAEAKSLFSFNNEKYYEVKQNFKTKLQSLFGSPDSVEDMFEKLEKLIKPECGSEYLTIKRNIQFKESENRKTFYLEPYEEFDLEYQEGFQVYHNVEVVELD